MTKKLWINTNAMQVWDGRKLYDITMSEFAAIMACSISTEISREPYILSAIVEDMTMNNYFVNWFMLGLWYAWKGSRS